MWAWHGAAAGLLSEGFSRSPPRAAHFRFTVRPHSQGRMNTGQSDITAPATHQTIEMGEHEAALSCSVSGWKKSLSRAKPERIHSLWGYCMHPRHVLLFESVSVYFMLTAYLSIHYT